MDSHQSPESIEPISSAEAIKHFYVICPEDGKQEVGQADTFDWGPEIEEMMGKKLITANCPKCTDNLTVVSE